MTSDTRLYRPFDAVDKTSVLELKEPERYPKEILSNLSSTDVNYMGNIVKKSDKSSQVILRSLMLANTRLLVGIRNELSIAISEQKCCRCYSSYHVKVLQAAMTGTLSVQI